MSEEFGNDIFTLTDEEGNEFEFEVLDMTEVDNQLYAALMPVHDDSQEYLDSDGQLVILKVIEENGEEILENITDEDELNRIFAVFEERLDSESEYELEN